MIRPVIAGFLSGQEMLLVLVAVLVLFGAKKIPEFAKGLGQGIKEFKKASREVQDEIERAGQETHTPPPAPPAPPLATESRTAVEVPPTETATPPSTAASGVPKA